MRDRAGRPEDTSELLERNYLFSHTKKNQIKIKANKFWVRKRGQRNGTQLRLHEASKLTKQIKANKGTDLLNKEQRELNPWLQTNKQTPTMTKRKPNSLKHTQKTIT